MKLLRIKADYTENNDEFIIFILVIDDSGKLKTDVEMFGYVFDADEEGHYKDPFIIKPTYKKDFMILEYGTGRDYSTDKVNLPQKELKVGEYFTRWQNLTDEYSYIISHIEKII